MLAVGAAVTIGAPDGDFVGKPGEVKGAANEVGAAPTDRVDVGAGATDDVKLPPHAECANREAVTMAARPGRGSKRVHARNEIFPP